MMQRRQAIASLAALSSGAAFTGSAQAQAWQPSGPVRIIVPIAAGGVTDAMARTLADELKVHLNTPVIVDNRPGGNFGIGYQALKSAKPDGLTLAFIFASAMTSMQLLYKNLPYKPSDFQPITTLSKIHFVLAVPKNSPYNTLADYVAGIKKQQTPALVGVSAVGGAPHLLMEELGANAKFPVQPIVYRGEAPAVQELVGGQLQAFCGAYASVSEFVKTDAVKVLAISSESRIPEASALPTFKEQGYPSAVVDFWFALAAPAGTPRNIVDTLHKAVVKSAHSPAFQARLKAQPDQHMTLCTPEEYNALVQRETEMWKKLITERGISVES